MSTTEGTYVGHAGIVWRDNEGPRQFIGVPDNARDGCTSDSNTKNPSRRYWCVESNQVYEDGTRAPFAWFRWENQLVRRTPSTR